MNWLRKSPSSNAAREQHVGLDITTSRFLAVVLNEKHSRWLPLGESSNALPLVIDAEGRTPRAGYPGLAQLRRRPHLAYSGFLTALGSAKPWRGGRHTLTADAALTLAFQAVRPVIGAESESVAFAVPGYLSSPQVDRLIDAAHKADLPLEGTIAAPLALVADRVASILDASAVLEETDEPVVVPIPPGQRGPGSVLVIDVDDHGLSGSLISVEPDRIRCRASAVWPRVAEKAWLGRLIDVVSDRCVRLSRRDPRDSGEAEQDLFEQLHGAIDRGVSDRVGLTLRTAQWFQAVVLQPEEFEDACSSLIQFAIQDVAELMASANTVQPPRYLWLTHEAGRLPGLARHLHANSAHSTVLEVLPREATATAVARLVPRWLNGELPKTHVGTELILATAAPGLSAPGRIVAESGPHRSVT